MLCLFTHPWYFKILNSIMAFLHKSYHEEDSNKADTRKQTRQSTIQFENDRGEGEYNKDVKNLELAKVIRKMTMHLFSVFEIPQIYRTNKCLGQKLQVEKIDIANRKYETHCYGLLQRLEL